MENVEGGGVFGISGCGWIGITSGVLAVGIAASPPGWIFVGGVAAAGFTTAGGIASAYSLSFAVAGIGCSLSSASAA